MTLVIETIKIRDKMCFENLLKHTDKKEGICRGKTKVTWECWGAKEMDTSPQNWTKQRT